MWQYVFLLLKRQPRKYALASSGFLLASCALILLSATTQTTVVQANQIISQSWRSSYDLVVLPPQAHVAPNGAIPADFLEGYDGGISIKQYEQIQKLPGIDIAAPIAYVGYVQMPVPPIEFFAQALPSGYYHLEFKSLAFNGQHQVIENTASINYYLDSSCGYNKGYKLSDAMMKALDKANIVLQCGTIPTAFFNTLRSPLTDTGTFLLAAIDPTEENKLIHLDKHITDGRMLTSQDTIQFSTNPNLGQIAGTQNCPGLPEPGQIKTSSCKIPNYDIPVLLHTQLPGKITLTGRFTHVASDALSPQTVLAHGGANYLSHLPNQQSLFDGPIPLVQDSSQRFAGASLEWNGQKLQLDISPLSGIDPESASLKFLYTPSALTYQSATAPDGRADNAYTLVPNGTQGPEVAFRQLHPVHIAPPTKKTEPFPTAFYFFKSVGQFSGDTLNAQFGNPLNWLPENTYTTPPTVLRYDAQGNPVKATNLLPTTNSAGFVLQPPFALTTLNAARKLRGDNIISAIRVRVSGVEAANPASWKRVQQVAGTIHQLTHLPVQVTLGSSPRPTIVYVPGVKQGQFGATQSIAPIGWVEERWIAVGASIIYLAQLGATRLLLLGSVLAVCLGYVIVAFSTLATSQRTELAVLSTLGWRPWQPVRLFLTQALLLALCGCIVGIGIALLTATLLEAIPIWPIVLWTLPAMLLLALLSSLYPLWQIWRIQPAEILRAGSTVSSAASSSWILPLESFLSPIASLVIRNLTRSRPRTLITLVSLFLSSLLLLLMFSSILGLRQTLTGTLLGNFVLLETAVPQIAGCVFALFLTFLSIADILLLQVQTRRQEIGLLQAVGWRTPLIQRMFMQEGLVLACVGTIPGVLAALWILTAQHMTQQSIPLPIIILGVVLLMGLIATLATVPALRTISRLPVVDVLRGE